VHVFPGNYEEFQYSKQRAAEAASQAAAPASAPAAANADCEAQPEDGRPKRINPQRARQMQERCDELEQLIARTESEIAACETALSNFVSVEETQRQTELLDTKRAELESFMGEWEDLASSLESAQLG
jgi:ATPase subunit of ABC transporter with duplicated ATPase domains